VRGRSCGARRRRRHACARLPLRRPRTIAGGWCRRARRDRVRRDQWRHPWHRTTPGCASHRPRTALQRHRHSGRARLEVRPADPLAGDWPPGIEGSRRRSGSSRRFESAYNMNGARIPA
jgi:hypothetical protein